MKLQDLIRNKIKSSDSLEELTDILKILIENHSIDENGNIYSIRALVEKVKGMKIEIYPNDHFPPHFHVKANQINAVFSINECNLLKGKIDKRELQLIQFWHQNSKYKLINFWNNTRPTN